MAQHRVQQDDLPRDELQQLRADIRRETSRIVEFARDIEIRDRRDLFAAGERTEVGTGRWSRSVASGRENTSTGMSLRASSEPTPRRPTAQVILAQRAWTSPRRSVSLRNSMITDEAHARPHARPRTIITHRPQVTDLEVTKRRSPGG